MEVHLKPEQEAYLKLRIREGRFLDTDHALQQAVSLLEQEETFIKRTGEAKSTHAYTVDDLIAAFQACPAPELDLASQSVESFVREAAF